MPDHAKPFQIECDTSKYASGAVLTQLDLNGDRHPCAFISKTFSPTERNYEIYDWELLAIIRALEEWRHYIQGSPHTTTILSDHKNLTYYWETWKLNWQLACWSLYLSKFDIKLIHTPGHKLTLSDALSQRPDFVLEDDNDNDNMTMLPNDLFINLIDLDLQKWIATCDTLDKDATDALAINYTKVARCRSDSHVLPTLIWVRCEYRVRSLFERVRSEGKSCSIFCAFWYQIRRSLAMVPSAFVGGTPLICAPRHCESICDRSHFPFCHSWQSNLCDSRRPHRPLHTICSK